ncbi:hypothetical protein [Listeria booriae]|uniref:hypothetical protein n=1 Tax=Listeria booriae TaxID=1552123 RepID=UPI001623D6FB|nr:hypothetical protein [Listeria booriae]MBC2324601.1 hypothetical protein [Listeria booriae]
MMEPRVVELQVFDRLAKYLFVNEIRTEAESNNVVKKMYDTNVRNTAAYDEEEGETANQFERDLNYVFFDRNVEAFDVVISHEQALVYLKSIYYQCHQTQEANWIMDIHEEIQSLFNTNDRAFSFCEWA